MYEGLNFSHVKFYHDLSAGLKNLQRKPQNFGDNWPLASRQVFKVAWAARPSDVQRTSEGLGAQASF